MTAHALTLVNVLADLASVLQKETPRDPFFCHFAASGANWTESGWNVFTELRFGVRLGIEVTVWCFCGCSQNKVGINLKKKVVVPAWLHSFLRKSHWFVSK